MARKTHTITTADYETLASAVKNPDIQIEAVEGGFSVRTDNRREERALADALESASKPAQQKTGNWTRRHIERADIAEQQGRSHGKCWYCGEIDIQTKGVHPSWEGDLICYVYE